MEKMLLLREEGKELPLFIFWQRNSAPMGRRSKSSMVEKAWKTSLSRKNLNERILTYTVQPMTARLDLKDSSLSILKQNSKISHHLVYFPAAPKR